MEPPSPGGSARTCPINQLAALVRHRQVAEQDVGMFASQDIQCLFGGVDRDDLGAMVREHVRYDVEDRTCVVNDQHPHTVEPQNPSLMAVRRTSATLTGPMNGFY
jgi:hypothetical protein